MSSAIDKPITWRSLIRVGLGWAAEYAVLGLIEDATVSLKIATVLCAIAALFILETENWLKTFGRYVFPCWIVIVSVIYLYFVNYAIQHARHEEDVNTQLSQFYRESSSILDLPFKAGMTTDEEQKWAAQIAKWRDDTSVYLLDNVGIFAQDRFLNTKGMATFSYGNTSAELNSQINLLSWLRKNLETIIDSRASAKK